MLQKDKFKPVTILSKYCIEYIAIVTMYTHNYENCSISGGYLVSGEPSSIYCPVSFSCCISIRPIVALCLCTHSNLTPKPRGLY